MGASIAIIGAGPRGISITERIAAYLKERSGGSVTLHIIDDAQLGAGRVWETEQTRTLCMNTLAGAVTLFTEPGATVGAPVFEGPTMYEWVQALRGERSHPLIDAYGATLPDQFTEELRATRPESNPSRALYGEYLRWVWKVALAQLPAGVEVVEHQSRAVSFAAEGVQDAITLADGSVVHADATVIASGWVLPAPTPAQQAFAYSGLTYIPPGNPVEQDVSRLGAGERVLVRGMGMGFFDLMALTTINRGGRFVEDASARSGLRYEATGREPHFVVTSGRGYPYLPKSEYHSLPPKADLTRLRAAIDASKVPVSFGRDLWPALARDAYAEYYRTLARVRPRALKVPLDAILTAIDATDLAAAASPDDILPVAIALTAALDGMSTEPFDMAAWVDPLAGTEKLDLEKLNRRIAGGMEVDIAEAVSAWDSPLKAGLWAISAGRKPSAIATQNGRGPHEAALSQYMAFGQMVGSGPPLFRTRELLALFDAGLITFLGPDPVVEATDGRYTATSHGRTVHAAALADAFLPGPDIRTSPDALTASLRDTGRARPFAPGGVETASPETDGATRRTVHPDGELDARLHIVGIPTGKQWADTTISPMPGTDPLMLQETDKTARSLLTQAGVL
ncbi:FAD/NAD(P)-binding protein [Corynebacterium ureicelerivorans]|uniref:FAD/NAD(P)-binding protein n=1 Tax=Corynebacterium ureicelerivorans TaxID=401472 RepID=UPI00264DC65D|nr:FAD/NAD(P)-binding protein [Corynebacterium ureicelerivorans]MDN8626719.1 FAD/NAD(P)-binding protein [Corynebacterium ureicelerivorans]